ncbi:pseudaminic acid cytidylyltransferase [Marinomonas sp. A79]|uniref:Pseudaminic acid cytidylyltransferase n=1 Tax=Marinomonas vulgaris TaxID=2823372 RepID=A0ABS5H789_9GAMM|nr:pseudaminic acid cytidylyltransferase [Marinomonas vulgaris]MBR7887581.1 pseudaminic acid cytidylyltransferase [Marinomonas vulgaris]
MNIAIIPARGGSKRIPRKNIKLFYGKPMIAYSIEAAKNAGCFDRIIVSTDDDEIANVATRWGAEVPFMRPSGIADDYATTMDVMEHAVNWCVTQGGAVNNVCCLYATAPFVLPKYLLQGLRVLSDNKVQFAFSATSFAFPIQRAIRLNDEQAVSMFSPEFEQTRSQDLVEAFHDAGQFYWGKAEAYIAHKPIFADHSRAIVLPRKYVQDIDTQEDWELAEALYKALAC